MGHTLPAKCTVAVLNLFIICHIHAGTASCINNIPDTEGLHLLTDLDTSHTLDALSGIPDQWELPVPWPLLIITPEWKMTNIQVIGQSLKGTVSASHTGGTVRVMP